MLVVRNLKGIKSITSAAKKVNRCSVLVVRDFLGIKMMSMFGKLKNFNFTTEC